MSYVRLFFILVLAALLFTALFVWPHRTPDAAYDDQDPTYNKAYWEHRFSQDVVETVYREFVERNANVSAERQHLAAHVVGGLLFKTRSVSGVTVCTPDFGFGCFHGFFGFAIADGGTERIKELDAVCIEAFGPLGTGCQHGIGHGILEYTGYARINDALVLCKETTQVVSLLGCTSGVFMEYNTPLAGAGEGLIPQDRRIDASNPHEPCPSVPNEYRASCYYELGQWLALAPGAFERTHDLCSQLVSDARAHCFLGMGTGLAFAHHYAVADTLVACGKLDAADEFECRAGASWGFFSDPQYRDAAGALCAYTDAMRMSACRARADLTEGKNHS